MRSLLGGRGVPREMPQSWFTSCKNKGHLVTLNGNKFKTNKRKYFLKRHIIYLWNSLPQGIIEVNSLARFKEGLDIYMNRNNIGSCTN